MNLKAMSDLYVSLPESRSLTRWQRVETWENAARSAAPQKHNRLFEMELAAFLGTSPHGITSGPGEAGGRRGDQQGRPS